jgi:general secretion pathway protein G
MSQPVQPGQPKKKLWKWLRMIGWIVGIILLIQAIAYFIVNRVASQHAGGKEGFQQDVEAKIQILNLEFLLGVHRRSKGRYPTEKEGLAAIFSDKYKSKDKTDIGEPDAVREKLLDPWKRRFQYRFPGIHNKKDGGYDLFSLGSDGIEDTEDDIKNW